MALEVVPTLKFPFATSLLRTSAKDSHLPRTRAAARLSPSASQSSQSPVSSRVRDAELGKGHPRRSAAAENENPGIRHPSY